MSLASVITILKQRCNEIKSLTRGYKGSAWELFTALEKEKPNHNAKAQQAITDYLTWGKNEIKKDLCFIDKVAMKQHLTMMIEQIKQAEPYGFRNNKLNN